MILNYFRKRKTLIDKCRTAISSCLKIMNPWEAKVVAKDIIDSGVITKEDREYLESLMNNKTTIKKPKK